MYTPGGPSGAAALLCGFNGVIAGLGGPEILGGACRRDRRQGTVGLCGSSRNLSLLPPTRDRAIARFTRKKAVSIAWDRTRALPRVPRDTLPLVAIARIARYRAGREPRDRHAVFVAFSGYRAALNT